MQMAAAYSAIANGGMLRAPRLVRRVDGTLAGAQGPSRDLQAGPRRSAPDARGRFAPGGTASEVSIPGYQLAGKTGTANKVDPRTGEYSKSNYIASFVGFAPRSTRS